MTAYYNENDPQAAAWLRELIAGGHIAKGEVDDRSILDVEPSDLSGFRQCHFFAGIGGWSLALRLAGWPDDRPVWTGSPPCQPFSVAGQQLGQDDARHLAPHFLELVAACRPPVVFGEQVASAAVFGKVAGKAGREAGCAPEWAWIDDLQGRLEAAHYAVGATDIPAAAVGAPHLRQRTFFGAYDFRLAAGGLADGTGSGRVPGTHTGIHRGEKGAGPRNGEPERSGATDQLADADRGQRDGIAEHEEHVADREARGRIEGHGEPAGRGATNRMADADGGKSGEAGGLQPGGEYGLQSQGGATNRMADADDAGPQRRAALPERADQRASGPRGVVNRQPAAGPTNGFWRDADWLLCTDGKWRPVEPGTQPLAHRVPGRVGLLRGYGNAIVPQAAAEFVMAFEKSVRDTMGPASD